MMLAVSVPTPAVPGRKLVLLAVAIGYVGVMLAVSPVSVALPTLASALRVEVEAASRVQTAYLLALTALVLPAGRMGGLIGHKPVFLVGVGLMTASATLLGVVGRLEAVVALRALEGVGSALVSGTTLAILTAAFRPSERGRVVSAATVAAALGAGGGTLLTPAVLDALGVGAVFWLIVPVGLLSLSLGLRMPAIPSLRTGSRSIDLPGAGLLAAALLALALSFSHLHEGEETFQAGWPFHTGMQLLAALLLGAFVWWERRVPEPLIRLEVVRNRRFAAAVTANGVFHMTMMATLFLTPFLFERAWGLTPLHVSLVVAAIQAVNLSAALLGGWVVDRTRWSWLPAASLAVIASGMLLLGLMAANLTFGSYVGVSLLLGVGSGFFNTSNNTAIMSILPGELRGFSAGMLETTRQFGHTIAVSLGAVAIGLAGASLQDAGHPALMIEGFRLAELVMGSIALAGVAIAWLGRAPRALAHPSPAPLPASGLVEAAP